jgi:hypothetical protein
MKWLIILAETIWTKKIKFKMLNLIIQNNNSFLSGLKWLKTKCEDWFCDYQFITLILFTDFGTDKRSYEVLIIGKETYKRI